MSNQELEKKEDGKPDLTGGMSKELEKKLEDLSSQETKKLVDSFKVRFYFLLNFFFSNILMIVQKHVKNRKIFKKLLIFN